MSESSARGRPGKAAVRGAPPASPVRVAGTGTASGEHWADARAIAGVMSRVWPHLDRRIAQLFDDSPGGRHLSVPVDELARVRPFSEQGPVYTDTALRLATRAARQALDQAGCDPDEMGALVVVSCTGFTLPGLDARLIPLLGLRDDVFRTPLTLLGCAGGVAGMAHGAGWVRARKGRRALVIAVELPSITFRPGDSSPDNVLSALVFSDGAGAVVLDDRPASRPTATSGAVLHLGRAGGLVIPDTGGTLGYELADDGYRVVLSRRVPALIEANLGRAVRAFVRGGVEALDVIAAHPGGGAILDAVFRSLGARPEQLAASWATLRAVGNSSSAAIFFVLAEIARSRVRPGARGLCVAFGPGLSVEMIEMTWLG